MAYFNHPSQPEQNEVSIHKELFAIKSSKRENFASTSQIILPESFFSAQKQVAFTPEILV